MSHILHVLCDRFTPESVKNAKTRWFSVAEVDGLMSLFLFDIFECDDWKYEGYTLLHWFAASESI